MDTNFTTFAFLKLDLKRSVGFTVLVFRTSRGDEKYIQNFGWEAYREETSWMTQV